MKLMNKLTLRYLKQNKKRTLLTIICMTVSVVMMSCVGIGLYSGQQLYRDYIKNTEGDYHYKFVSHYKEPIEIIKNDSHVKEYYFSSTMSFDYENTSLTIKNGDTKYFDKLNINEYLIDGRMPQKSNEISMSQAFIHNYKKHIGDHIILKDGEGNKKRYVIVGVTKLYHERKDPNLQSFDAFGYIDPSSSSNEWYTMYVNDKDLSYQIYNHGHQIKEQIEPYLKDAVNFDFHTGFLASYLIFEQDAYSTFGIIYSIAALLLIIIVIVSVFIIYQAFQLSIHNRIMYLGMLSSIGATPKQKRKSVYFEGFLLSLIAIPLGIIISFIGLGITFMFINKSHILQPLDISIKVAIIPIYLLSIIVLSVLTIFISLYLPARKISKIAPIDILKKDNDVKIKKTKQSFFIKRSSIYLQYALKNYKRQGHKARVIILSLVISMVSFISIYSFTKYSFMQIQYSQDWDIDFNINQATPQLNENIMHDIKYQLASHQWVKDYKYYITTGSIEVKLNPSYYDFDLKKTYMYSENSPNSVNANIIVLDNEDFQNLCQQENLSSTNDVLLYCKNITYNTENEQIIENPFHKVDQNFIQGISFDYQNYLDFHYNLQSIDNLSYEYMTNDFTLIFNINQIQEIFPNNEQYSIKVKIKTDHTQEIIDTLEKTYTDIDINNHTLSHNTLADVLLSVFNILVYGFVVIMIFFTMMNMINMMSASIYNRRKEFSMMASVGMSFKELKKVIWYESFIYGVKTFIYSLPICIFIEYIFYDAIYIEKPFMISIEAYLLSFVVIIFIMFMTFRVGLKTLSKQNIAEVLKDDM